MNIPTKPTETSPKNEEETRRVSNMIRLGGSKFLARLKQKSLRSNNCWYRVLSLDKRRFIDAVIETVQTIRSSLLLKILSRFAQKLFIAIGGIRGFMGNLAYEMQNYGQPLALRISVIAEKWGNKSAKKWATDPGFVRYLAVLDMNSHRHPIFKTSMTP